MAGGDQRPQSDASWSCLTTPCVGSACVRHTEGHTGTEAVRRAGGLKALISWPDAPHCGSRTEKIIACAPWTCGT